MWNLFFRRKHQKLDEISEDLPELTNRQSDLSSGSDSNNSVDHTIITNELNLSTPIEEGVDARQVAKYPSRYASSEYKSRRSWRFRGYTNRRDSSSPKRPRTTIEKKDETEQIRKSINFTEYSSTRSTSNKISNAPNRIGSGTWMNEVNLNHSISAEVLPREVTWRRRVSSLEAFFQRECKSKYSDYRDTLESALMKVIPFESSIAKSESSVALNDDDSRVEWSKYQRRKFTRRKSTFEETVEQGVSEIIDKITSRGEEILESVPNWNRVPDSSVVSSSVDFMSATSDDDEMSASGYPQVHSWSPTMQSISSEDEDDYFSTDAGCNSVESCTMMTKEIGTFLEEMMPRDTLVLSCLGQNERKSRHRKKRL
jgi:hypothetical protein